MGSMSELDERRQRAREAYWDNGGRYNDPDGHPEGAEAAIETATRVRITPEIAEAACTQAGIGPGNIKRMLPIIAAAFRAAGFEVEE